jgi:hypothetical protein
MARTGRLPFIWSVVQFFLVRARDARHREFEGYHKLVRELLQPEQGASGPYLDRQAAVVYELRHYKRYFSISQRMLKHLRSTWSDNQDSIKYARLIEEIDLTLEFLKKRLG